MPTFEFGNIYGVDPDLIILSFWTDVVVIGMGMWRWSSNKFRKIDIFEMGLYRPKCLWSHIEGISYHSRRMSLFSTRPPFGQSASVHQMLNASVPWELFKLREIRSGQVRPRRIKSIQVKLGQIQINSGQVRSGWFKSGKIRSSYVRSSRSSQVKSGEQSKTVFHLESPSLELEKDSLRLCL